MNRPIVLASITAFLIVLASISAFLMPVPCSADPPRFVREHEFSCKDTADAVNYYADLGEDKAIREMLAAVDDDEPTLPSMRICHLCRILFEPIGEKPLRSALLGVLQLPTNSMPIQKWPRFPIAEAGTTFFLLNESYSIKGVPESPTAYIKYCRKDGVFRKNRVVVPTREKALQDLDKLRQSEAWKSIKWTDSGQNWYVLHEEDTLRYLKGQADRTPPK